MIHSEQPRSQALSSMRRRRRKTLVGAGHVIDQILIAQGGVGKVSYYMLPLDRPSFTAMFEYNKRTSLFYFACELR